MKELRVYFHGLGGGAPALLGRLGYGRSSVFAVVSSYRGKHAHRAQFLSGRCASQRYNARHGFRFLRHLPSRAGA